MRYPHVPETKTARKKVRRVMHEFKHHKLYTRGGRLVTKRRQAVRIALEEARHIRRRHHRHNPEHAGTGKWLAFGLIGFGVYLFWQSQQQQMIAAAQTPNLSSIGTSLSSIFNSVKGLFGGGSSSPAPTLPSGGTSVTYPDVLSGQYGSGLDATPVPLITGEIGGP